MASPPLPSSPTGSPPHASISAQRQQQQQHQLTGLRELGGLAAWSVTSAKPGNGVELLRDGSTETYWQSDGTQPHLVNIQFSKRVELKELHIYLDYKADESYTPSRLAVRAGSTHHDLKDVCIVELKEPTGWIVIPLGEKSSCMKAFSVQVAVLANHQNGRDTHMRQILLYGPAASSSGSMGCFAGTQFDTPEFTCFSVVR